MKLNRKQILILAVCACAIGCGKGKGASEPVLPGDPTAPTPKVDTTLCETSNKRVATFDLNHDNQPDVWKLYRNYGKNGAFTEVLTCKQVDLDHDTRKDMVVGYNDKGLREFEKFDMDFDGKFDAYYIYDSKGRVIEVQRDLDYDGKYDIKELYDDKGLIKSVRRDRNGDQSPDVWEQYKQGTLVAILYDEDYDGKVDRRDRVKSETESQLPPPESKSPDATSDKTAPSPETTSSDTTP